VFEKKTSPFKPASIASLKRALAAEDLASNAPVIVALSRREERVYLVAHATEEGIVLDLEPIVEETDLILEGALQAQSLVKTGVAHLQDSSHEPLEVNMQLVCDELRGLLNYDRVMMYQFHEDQHGEVMAESVSQFADDAFMGLHFPSTDIPQANRAIFMSMRSRMIADVANEATQVLQSARLSNNILLGSSQLRGVTGCHGQYLSNMGVKATLMLSVVVTESQTRMGRPSASPHKFETSSVRSGGSKGFANAHEPKEKLWGLIMCHHYQSPHRVAYYQRSAAEFLVRIFATHLGRSMQVERQKLEHSLLQHQAAVCTALKRIEELGGSTEQIPMLMASVLGTESGGTSLRLAANATGVAYIFGESCQRVGECPKVEEIRKLVAWMQSTGAAHNLEVAEVGLCLF
jgi:light-regulated signal transduction histidine kinase (bacteriophytochrome)